MLACALSHHLNRRWIDLCLSLFAEPLFVIGRLRMLAQQSAAVGVSEKEREILLRGAGVLGNVVATCERFTTRPVRQPPRQNSPAANALPWPKAATRLRSVGRLFPPPVLNMPQPMRLVAH